MKTKEPLPGFFDIKNGKPVVNTKRKPKILCTQNGVVLTFKQSEEIYHKALSIWSDSCYDVENVEYVCLRDILPKAHGWFMVGYPDQKLIINQSVVFLPTGENTAKITKID